MVIGYVEIATNLKLVDRDQALEVCSTKLISLLSLFVLKWS